MTIRWTRQDRHLIGYMMRSYAANGMYLVHPKHAENCNRILKRIGMPERPPGPPLSFEASATPYDSSILSQKPCTIDDLRNDYRKLMETVRR